MPEVTFSVDRQLHDDVLHTISMHAKSRDIRTGDLLITLMAVTKEWIKAGKMPQEAEAMVLDACIKRLLSEAEHARLRADVRLNPYVRFTT